MKHLFKLFVILLTIGSIEGQNQDANYKLVQFPEGYTSQIDVVYTTIGTWNGRMDLYTNPKSALPTPIVINIHGGGWNHGVKESQTGYGSFFKNGYAVANVAYRLVNVAKAPGAIEDVRCALIYLYTHSKALNIDPNKIVVMGGSSGGHLALITGLLVNDKRFDTNCNYDGAIKVAAIIDKYGVTDLEPLSAWKSAKNWLGDQYNDPSFVKSISPLTYVTKNSPPVYIVHGNSDPIVPYAQSLVLYEKLKSSGVKTKMMTVEGGGHGKFSKEENNLISKDMWLFLEELGLKN